MTKRSFASVLLAWTALSSFTQADPILEGMPDPSIIQYRDGSFYVFTTGTGLPIYRSEDLREWKEVDRVFASPVPAWAAEAVRGTRGIWAPDVAKINDRYYVYYSVSTFGSQRSVIGVAASRSLDPNSPAYGWEDLGLVVGSAPGQTPFNAIDAAPFQDEDGRAYLVWGSFFGGIFLAELDPNTGKLKDDAEHRLVAHRAAGNNAVEAPFLSRRGDFYYLWISWDSCCAGAESTYKIMIGRSESPTGPFLDHTGRDLVMGGGTLVLANHDVWRGPAHNSFVSASNGDWIAHHTYDTRNLHLQRIGQVRPVYWTADGWPVAGEPVSAARPMPTGPATIRPEQIHGTWRISVNYQERELVDLIPGGRVAFDGGSSWALVDGVLSLRRQFNQHELFVEPSGDSFIGRTAAGDIIRGVKVRVD
jgi:arabinan endo-1,5-alpha-L-arabinosidase